MKNVIKTLVISFVLFFSFLLDMQAQQFGIGGRFMKPMNDFATNSQAVGGGVGMNFSVPFTPKSPLSFGFEASYMLYGRHSRRMQETFQISTNNTVIAQIPIDFRVTTQNNLLNGLTFLRLQAPHGAVQPYIDAIGGLSFFYTRTRIIDRNARNQPSNYYNQYYSPNNSLIASETHAASIALNYGGGLGVMVRLSEHIALDLRGVYLLGGEAEYFDRSQTRNWELEFVSNANSQEGDFQIADPGAAAKRSSTDMLQFTVGLSFTW
ncbi:MAG: hypothetical protein JJT94_12060 [Bernardetiaceae bacterium]|nr:hypothetical protein [Bernardetiaceae bacterium]